MYGGTRDAGLPTLGRGIVYPSASDIRQLVHEEQFRLYVRRSRGSRQIAARRLDISWSVSRIIILKNEKQIGISQCWQTLNFPTSNRSGTDGDKFLLVDEPATRRVLFRQHRSTVRSHRKRFQRPNAFRGCIRVRQLDRWIDEHARKILTDTMVSRLSPLRARMGTWQNSVQSRRWSVRKHEIGCTVRPTGGSTLIVHFSIKWKTEKIQACRRCWKNCFCIMLIF